MTGESCRDKGGVGWGLGGRGQGASGRTEQRLRHRQGQEQGTYSYVGRGRAKSYDRPGFWEGQWQESSGAWARGAEEGDRGRSHCAGTPVD